MQSDGIPRHYEGEEEGEYEESQVRRNGSETISLGTINGDRGLPVGGVGQSVLGETDCIFGEDITRPYQFLVSAQSRLTSRML